MALSSSSTDTEVTAWSRYEAKDGLIIETELMELAGCGKSHMKDIS